MFQKNSYFVIVLLDLSLKTFKKKKKLNIKQRILILHSTGAVDYTDSISADGLDPHPVTDLVSC